MSNARSAEQLPPLSTQTERERFIAAVEEGLADVKAGRVRSHAEVLAWIDERFPGSE